MIDDMRQENKIRLANNLDLEVAMNDPRCSSGYIHGRRVSIYRLIPKIRARGATAVEVFMGDAPLGFGYKFKSECT